MDQTTRRRSKNQERRAAQAVGGRVQPGSGAPAFYKSDVRKLHEIRMECKTTSKGAYTLKLDELLKIATEALMGGLESWVLQFEFQGSVGMNRKWAVVDWGWYEYLAQHYLAPGSFLTDSLEAQGQSIKLLRDALEARAGSALTTPGVSAWALCVTFPHPNKKYAVIDWTLFQHLREVAK